jgi:hypothetical protein
MQGMMTSKKRIQNFLQGGKDTKNLVGFTCEEEGEILCLTRSEKSMLGGSLFTTA